MGGMKVSNMDFIKLLPAFMQDDEAAIALSKAVNKLIGEPGKRLATIRTWDKVDELTEAECNEMAWELDIDWYDSEGMSLTEKRNTIKLAQQIKRKRGTKWAVERLIGAYFGEGYVMEWFEMDDSPYTFAALTTNANTDSENFNKFVDAVQAAKNVRSHIAGVFYYWQQGPDPGIECALNTELHRYDFVNNSRSNVNTNIGFRAALALFVYFLRAKAQQKHQGKRDAFPGRQGQRYTLVLLCRWRPPGTPSKPRRLAVVCYAGRRGIRILRRGDRRGKISPRNVTTRAIIMTTQGGTRTWIQETSPPFWREYTRGRIFWTHTTRQQARSGTATT